MIKTKNPSKQNNNRLISKHRNKKKNNIINALTFYFEETIFMTYLFSLIVVQCVKSPISYYSVQPKLDIITIISRPAVSVTEICIMIFLKCICFTVVRQCRRRQ